MVRTWKGRGLALLAAAPLLGAAPATAYADGPGPTTHKSDKGSVSKPAPRPRTHAKPKVHVKPKAHAQSKGHVRPKGVVLRMESPGQAVVPGRIYEWTFTVTAKGPKSSGQAVFRTTLPKSLAFVSGERDCRPAGQRVVCHLGTVRRGRKAVGVVRAKVSRLAEPGETISPRGTVTWGKAHVTRRFPAVRVARTADLALTKTAPATARKGAKIPYTLRVRNLGPATAGNVTVESGGPIEVVGRDTACVPTGRVYRCAVGSLRAGESRALHLEAVPREDVRAGTVLESSWTAVSPVTDTDEANNRAVVRTKITERRRPGGATRAGGVRGWSHASSDLH